MKVNRRDAGKANLDPVRQFEDMAAASAKVILDAAAQKAAESLLVMRPEPTCSSHNYCGDFERVYSV